MKTNRHYLLLIASFLFLTLQNVKAQRTMTIITDGAAISSEVSETTKSEIITVVKQVMNNYYNVASFWDPNNEVFDEEKYTTFISLFSGSARVYEDIANKPTNIEYAVYANNVFQFMQEEGVQFDIENAYLNSISKDESGFYVAELDIDKIVYVGLDKDNFPVKFGDGRRYKLNVKIDMPDYDLTSAKIQSITGQEAAKRVKTSSYVAANFFYGLGGFIVGAPNEFGGNFGELTSTSASTLGAQLLFRKALNTKEALWWHFGVGAQQHSLATSFNNFDNSSLTADQKAESEYTKAFKNGASPQVYNVEDGKPLQGVLTINGVDESLENINIITVDVPIGITMRLNRTFSSRIFFDISAVPSYSLSSSGKTKGNPTGVIIPNSKHFPSIDQIKASPDGEARLAKYNIGSDFNFEDNTVTTTSNFGLGIQLSPTYQYDISFNYGIEIGFNLWYNVLSLTAVNNTSDAYLGQLFDNNSEVAKTSILEDYFKGANPYYASIKLGFFYKLN